MLALGKNIDFEKLIIRYAVAVPYEKDLIAKYTGIKNLTIYGVSAKLSNWDNKIIDADLSMDDVYSVVEFDI